MLPSCYWPRAVNFKTDSQDQTSVIWLRNVPVHTKKIGPHKIKKGYGQMLKDSHVLIECHINSHTAHIFFPKTQPSKTGVHILSRGTDSPK